MDPRHLLRIVWQDARARMIFPGLMLFAGALLAAFPTTGGRLVCDQGMCVQERMAAFGTVRDAIMYPTSEIEEFRIERGAQGEMTRVVIDLRGASLPLTIPFTLHAREVDRIAIEGARFLDDGAQARFVAVMEAVGIQSFYKPLALILLVLGAGFAGWVVRGIPRDDYRLR